MDGQQVFVTGADGEQMVLSGPEAAALLAQAGISLGGKIMIILNIILSVSVCSAIRFLYPVSAVSVCQPILT